MDVHGPYLPGDDFTYRNKYRAEKLWRKAAVNSPEEITPEEHDELWQNYRKEVEYLDREIGSFLDTLSDRGNLENTAVIIVGDHGDEFAEHELYGHGNLPYDELTHVPLLIQFPDAANIEQPQEVDSLVRTIDILPTMLDLGDADLTQPMQERMEGESLLPTFDGSKPTYDMIVTEKEMRGEEYLRFGFRTEQWKYLYDGKTDDTYLYNLDDDSKETTNVVDAHPEVVTNFEKQLDERLETIEQTSEGITIPEIEDDQGVEQRLEALGYK